MKHKNFEKFLRVTILWLVKDSGINQNHLNKLPRPLEIILEKFLRVLRTRGTKAAISFCKERRAVLFRLLSLNSRGIFSSSTVGVPKDLRFLLNNEEFSVPYIKLLLTILYSSRVLRTKAEPSFSTITGASELRSYPFTDEDFVQFWSSLGYSSTYKPVKSIKFKRYHKTTKAGPNGHALWCSMRDLSTLFINDRDILYHIFIVGGEKLHKYIACLINFFRAYKDFLPVEPGISRKLIYFADREGKTREVAIFDYFSQTSLIPLHNYLFKALKKIPQDYTFDQTGYMSTLSNSTVFYSIDLTAFTDRFPVRLNRDLISARVGDSFADSWLYIMTRPFSSEFGEIQYSVGNPMGAYSSWNSTTLSHHFVVWKACKNKSVEWSTCPYAMLGDDLVIGDPIVAKEYCRLIRMLGVHWSKEKTHVSPHFFEFAKRLHWCGEDISPFPIAGLWSEKDRIIGQLGVIDNAMSKGWFSGTDVFQSFSEYFSLQGLPRRLRSRRIDLMRKAWSFISVLQKKSSALELLPFVEKISPDVAMRLNEEKIFNILISSIMLSFVDSAANILDSDKHPTSLGLVAERLVCLITSPIFTDKEDLERLLDLPESLPHTHVWGLISEDYLQAHKEAYIIDTIRKGNWDPLLKNLRIPITDECVYFSRKTELLYIHSLVIVEKFEDSILQLSAYPQLI